MVNSQGVPVQSGIYIGIRWYTNPLFSQVQIELFVHLVSKAFEVAQCQNGSLRVYVYLYRIYQNIVCEYLKSDTDQRRCARMHLEYERRYNIRAVCLQYKNHKNKLILYRTKTNKQALLDPHHPEAATATITTANTTAYSRVCTPMRLTSVWNTAAHGDAVLQRLVS